jgi:hypothetical protein
VDEPTEDDSPYIETHDLSLVTREGPVYTGVDLAFRRDRPRGAVVRRRQAFTMEDLHPSLEMV